MERNSKPKRMLVTGGAGFIGSHIVDALLKKGHDVVVYDNLSTGKLSNLDHIRDCIRFIQADIRDLESLKRASEKCSVAFHLAAMVSVPQTVEEPIDSCGINEAGTLNVFEACRQSGVERVVFSSSCAVYGDDPNLPKREAMIPKPQTPYAVQKLAGEHYATVYNGLYGLQAVSLRYFNVFGPRQDPSSPYSGVISIFLNKAARNEKPVIHGSGDQTRDFIFVSDVVNANILAAEAPQAPGKVLNIGTGVQVSINRLWDLICEINGIRISSTYAPVRAGDILKSEANIDAAKSILNFKPRYSMSEGLKITNDWYGAERTL
jgi:UDP-glucose 4-epimerase